MSETIQTVWIIDDDEIYKYGFRKYISIKKICHNVFEFSNGREAINYLKDPTNNTHLPDIIFLDIDMPILDGWGFLNEFSDLKKQIDKTITLLMVTSSLNYNDIVRAKSYPEVTDYIVKPINIGEFSTALNFGLEKSA